MIVVNGKEDCKKAIQKLGQDLIDRAEDITNDLDGILSITVYAQIKADEIVNFDVTKNYIAGFNKLNS